VGITTYAEELQTFASKIRRYSTTLGAIRAERRAYRQRQAAEHARELLPDEADTTLVITRWKFTGVGYLSSGDAALALSAAARAHEQRQAAREAASMTSNVRGARVADEYLTIPEVVAELRIPRSTVYY
jgi:hypothetical protein